MSSEEQMVPMRYYVLKLTPAQLALATEALHAYAENRIIDLNEIENRKHREVVRAALSIRRLALQDLLTVLEKVVIDDFKGDMNEGE